MAFADLGSVQIKEKRKKGVKAFLMENVLTVKRERKKTVTSVKLVQIERKVTSAKIFEKERKVTSVKDCIE